MARILWKPKVHYSFHNSMQTLPVLSQIDSVHVPHPTSRRSVSILFSHLHLGLSSCLLPPGFSTKTMYAPLLSPFVLHVQPFSFFIFGEEYRTQSSSLCSFSTPLSQSIRHYKDTQRYDIPCCSVATLISCSVLWEEHKSNVLRKSFLE